MFAPQTITNLQVNGVAVNGCRDGDYLTFPCAGAEPVVPEVPVAVLLPVLTMLIAAGAVAHRRRTGPACAAA